MKHIKHNWPKFRLKLLYNKHRSDFCLFVCSYSFHCIDLFKNNIATPFVQQTYNTINSYVEIKDINRLEKKQYPLYFH